MDDRSWTEINLSNFSHNLTELKAFLPESTSFMQIVKADAYGHGALEIAKIALKKGAVMLGVANAEEGTLLRYQGITAPILILSPSLTSEIKAIIENDLICTLSDLPFAEHLDAEAQKAGMKAKVHIKLDTGMHRSGFSLGDAEKVFDAISFMKGISIEGIFSHFAASESDPDFTMKQTQNFISALTNLPKRPEYVHIANSAAVLSYHIPYMNMVRLGLMSYGIYPSADYSDRVDLKPVMQFKTRISLIKYLRKGESVGYNRTFIASKDMKIAILPVGYADGYDFMLSNKGFVEINTVLCPVIGKISMDMTAVDVSQIYLVEVGDEVILLGGDKKELRAENLAALYSGNSYELLCQIGRRAKRYYLDNGKVISSSPLLRRDFVSKDFTDQKLSSIIETALSQRLQNKELSSLIFHDILKMFFFNRDRDIHYRRHFEHEIIFREENDPAMKDFFHTQTKLSYRKVLKNDYFIVACANNTATLDRYFKRSDVEYRWLIDENFSLSQDTFKVTSVMVDDMTMKVSSRLKGNCLEIYCSHDSLKKLVGREVRICIETETYYARKSHQFSVYINDLTRGVNVLFTYPQGMNVEAIPIFAGQNKFPKIKMESNSIRVSSKKDEWVFPQSGIVFTY